MFPGNFKNKMSAFTENKLRSGLLLFMVSLVFNFMIIGNFYKEYIGNDGVGYHNIAVNIVKGNGFSECIEAPFKSNYFREPGYPFFIAACYLIYEKFLPVQYLRELNPDGTAVYTGTRPEIQFVKYVQGIIAALTVLLIYLTFRLVIKARLAFIISFLYIFYLPVVFHTTQILKETIYSFIIVSIAYSFARYLLSKQIKWLIITSVMLGLSILVFQFTFMLPVFMALFALIRFRTFKAAMVSFVLPVIFIVMVAFPWIYRTYLFYPDWRVAKSFGLSYTRELNMFSIPLFKMYYLKKIDDQRFREIAEKEVYKLNDFERFQYSFDGQYRHKADSLNKIIKIPLLSRDFFRLNYTYLRNSWFETFLVFTDNTVPDERKDLLRSYSSGNYLIFIILCAGLLFGYLGIPGLFMYLKETYVILIPFFYFTAFFFIIGTESRRFYPVRSFMFMFSCLFMVYLINFLRAKNKFRIAD